MAGVFQDVHLEWDGKRYTVPSDRMMGAIARIEEHVTLSELLKTGRERETVKLAVLARAYATVLRYAGADVTDEDVYGGMFAGMSQTAAVRAAVESLMAMMVPPQAIAAVQNAGGAVTPGNLNRRARRAAASSSRKRTS